LGDEVKVTVIATGFKANDNMSNKSSVSSELSMSHPEAFAKKSEERREKQAFEKRRDDRAEEEVTELPKSKKEEELDIPAFLRKKLRSR
jgi:hypothetical protein